MKKKKKIILALAAGVAAAILFISGYVVMYIGLANDLGLTRFDLAIGGSPDVEVLRAETRAVADSYLTQHQSQLIQICGEPHRFTVDYSLTPRIRSLGYRSCFYYYHWNIYLPYSVVTETGKKFIVVVQLSDAIQGHNHDPDKFQVVRSMVLDENNQTIETIER